MSDKTFKALGAYIFAGGFTRGVLDTKRFEVLAHLEESAYGVRTAKLNLPDLPIHVGESTWAPEAWAKKKIDFVYGNPPCAAWSALNGKKTKQDLSWRQDPRVNCTRRHFELLRVIQPKVWTWESVDRAFITGLPFIAHLTNQALELGYSVSHLRFDAQHVGGLHRRPRYFMVAHKVDFDWETWIKFVQAPPIGEVLKRSKLAVKGDERSMPLAKAYLPAWKKAQPGETLREVWDRLHAGKPLPMREASTGRMFVVGRPSFKNVKLHPDKVSPVIAGTNMVHWAEPRSLSIAEMKAVCGYPPKWVMEDTQGHELWNLFTRAVMPPIGKWLAGLVAQALEANKKIKKPQAWEVDLRKKSVSVSTFGPHDFQE